MGWQAKRGGSVARTPNVRIHYRKATDSSTGYLMEHTAVMFLMAPDGTYLTHIPPDMPPRRIAETIRQHMADSRSPPSAAGKPQ